jgi:hypothetical protein
VQPDGPGGHDRRASDRHSPRRSAVADPSLTCRCRDAGLHSAITPAGPAEQC